MPLNYVLMGWSSLIKTFCFILNETHTKFGYCNDNMNLNIVVNAMRAVGILLFEHYIS